MEPSPQLRINNNVDHDGPSPPLDQLKEPTFSPLENLTAFPNKISLIAQPVLETWVAEEV
jgi:hypothetical protein